MSSYDKYRDLKGTAALGLTTRSIGQARTRRNYGSSSSGRDNHSSYDSINHLRGQELQDHVMSVKDEVDQSADEVCDDIDQRVDSGLSEFLGAQQENLSLEENNDLKDRLQDILDQTSNDLYQFKMDIGWG